MRTGESNQSRFLDTELFQNILILQDIFEDSPDLIIRTLTIGKTDCKAALIYLSSLVQKKDLQEHVIKPLLDERAETPEAITLGGIAKANRWTEVEAFIFHGKSVLLVDGMDSCYILDTEGWPERALEDPQIEPSLKGSHQGFLESGGKNIALIRRFIPNRELKIKTFRIGRRGDTKVSVLYIADLTNNELLLETIKRLESLDIDAVLSTGELAELIEDHPYSPFPQFIITERPDSTASHLLQGRVAVIVDRSPGVLIGPTTFFSFLQGPDDYGTRWLLASFLRILRFVGMFMAIFLPAIYIAMISYNYEIIPVKLILSIGESREKVPFPPVVEALLMELTLEMLREAGIRLPAPVGQTVGIVGGIVIGQAAVQAGIVSNIMVIVVAFTAIASFIIPNFDMASAVRLIRFPMMLLASMFGIVGIMVGFMAFIGHLITLRSMGAPYDDPIDTVHLSDLKDTLIRLPLWLMKARPSSTQSKQVVRQDNDGSAGERR